MNDIQETAWYWLEQATCTLQEYLSVNPDDDAGDYADAIIAMMDMGRHTESELAAIRGEMVRVLAG